MFKKAVQKTLKILELSGIACQRPYTCQFLREIDHIGGEGTCSFVSNAKIVVGTYEDAGKQRV